jgi:hypothetical protein
MEPGTSGLAARNPAWPLDHRTTGPQDHRGGLSTLHFLLYNWPLTVWLFSGKYLWARVFPEEWRLLECDAVWLHTHRRENLKFYWDRFCQISIICPPLENTTSFWNLNFCHVSNWNSQPFQAPKHRNRLLAITFVSSGAGQWRKNMYFFYKLANKNQ